MGEKAPEISSLSFEEALKELEALSQHLSQGGLPLNWIKSSVISRMMTNQKKPP